MTKLGNNYYVQDGCHNCAHAFKCDEYDFWSIFCTYGAPKRPPGPCRDDHMPRATEAQEDAAWEVWEDWERGRRVTEAGICDRWKHE